MPTKLLKYTSNQALLRLITNADTTHRMELTKLFYPKSNAALAPVEIVEEISKAGGHKLVNLLRGHGVSYSTILQDVAKKLKIITLLDKNQELSEDQVTALESQVVNNILQKVYLTLDDKQKKEWDKNIQSILSQYQDNSLKKAAGVGGLIALGNLGGFATYTFLTSSMSALSLGTLSFGAYTTATTILSVVLGPIGIGVISSYAAYAYGKPNYEKLIKFVFRVFALRNTFLPNIKSEPILISPKTEEASIENDQEESVDSVQQILLVLKAIYMGRGIREKKVHIQRTLEMIDDAIEHFKGKDDQQSELRWIFYILLKSEILKGSAENLELRKTAKSISETGTTGLFALFMKFEGCMENIEYSQIKKWQEYDLPKEFGISLCHLTDKQKYFLFQMSLKTLIEKHTLNK